MPRNRTPIDETEDRGLVAIAGNDGGDDDLLDDDDRPSRFGRSQAQADEDAGMRAELARLRSENDRLRAMAGLEGRREEPATVGDLLDLSAAQTSLVRQEVERVLVERGDVICDAIAERVEERLLDTVAPESGTGKGGKTVKAGAGRRGAGKPAPRSTRELDGPYVRKGKRGLWFVDEAGAWYDEDGTPDVDDSAA